MLGVATDDGERAVLWDILRGMTVAGAELTTWLMRLAVGSLVLPTVLCWGLGASPRPPARMRRSAWACLWAGQSLVVLLELVWLALGFGQHAWRVGYRVAAVVFGLGGAWLGMMLCIPAVLLLYTGVGVLRGWRGSAVVARCDAIVRRLLRAMVVGGVLWMAASVVRIPGRFGEGLVMIWLMLVAGCAGTMLVAAAMTEGTAGRS